MNLKKFLACIFLIAIASFFCMFIFSIAFKSSEKLSENPNINIDWEKLFPFDENKSVPKKLSFLEEKASLIKSIIYLTKAKLNGYTSEKLPGYRSLVEAAKKYEDIIGWQMTSIYDYNPVKTLKGGYLASFVASRDVSQNAEAIINFSEFCKKSGSEFCYISIPYKICESEDKNISGVLDFTNQNANRLLARLDEAGVKNYNLEKFLHIDGKNHHESFFIADHHWKPETGLWAAGKTLEILRDDFSFDVRPEILEPRNFDRVIYRDWFLGSQGKKLTLSRAKPEDISLIYPKFKTLINFQVPERNLNVSGDFSITYDMNSIAVKDYYGSIPYGAYKYGDQPLTITRNELDHSGKKLLIIHDSFANCMIPFLSLGVGEIYDINLGYFRGSVRNFIKSHKVDIVIVIYYSELLGSSSYL